MNVRKYKEEDLEQLRSLHERTFDFPVPNGYNIVNLVVEEESKIIGFLTVRLTSETILVIKESERKRVRSQAVQQLISCGLMECQKVGLDETHAFLTGVDAESWCRVLEQRFGALKCKGIPIVLQFGG